MSDIYKQALDEVRDYGVTMGWVYEGTDTCDMLETMTRMAELDDAGELDDDIRPSFLLTWNGFANLLAPASKFRNLAEGS